MPLQEASFDCATSEPERDEEEGFGKALRMTDLNQSLEPHFSDEDRLSYTTHAGSEHFDTLSTDEDHIDHFEPIQTSPRESLDTLPDEAAVSHDSSKALLAGHKSVGKDARPAQPMIKAIAFMCCASFFVVVTSAVTQQLRQLEHKAAIPDLVFFRNLPNLILMPIAASLSGASPFSNPFKGQERQGKLWALYLARLIFPICAFASQILSLSHVSLSTYTVIFQTNPFIISLLSYFFLNVAISRGEVCAMVVCFVCVALVATSKPNQSEEESTPLTQEEEVAAGSTSGQLIGMIMALCVALFFSCQTTLVSKLKGVSAFTQLFHQGSIAMFVCTCAFSFQLATTGSFSLLALSGQHFVLLVTVSVSDTLMMLSLCKAFQCGTPSLVALFGYTSLIHALLFDVFVFDRPVGLGQLVPTLVIALVTITLGIAKAKEQ